MRAVLEQADAVDALISVVSGRSQPLEPRHRGVLDVMSSGGFKVARVVRALLAVVDGGVGKTGEAVGAIDDRGDNFQCQGCDAVCDWETRRLVKPHPGLAYKTIASRYCSSPGCVEAEAAAHGLSVERVLDSRRPGGSTSISSREQATPVRARRRVDDRAVELARRLVASGPKASHVSASECHEISEYILDAYCKSGEEV
jgi:hypothetical protein